ncbi:CopG family transcriptional regulator [Richelia sinica FACHB-800]|nr:CopG family transcriptional regulator [Richelia sinica FACHB-800]
MARPGGNPDFGTKYRFDYGRDEPLSEQVKVLMHPQMKDQLKHLADLEKCTVPDLIREAIEQYLTTKKATKLTSTPTNLTV